MTDNIFDVVIGRTPNPLKWDAAWRVVEWLATPGEGHGLANEFCDHLTQLCFGEPLSPVDIKVEFKLGVDKNGDGKWPDMVVAYPALPNPKAVALMDDISVRSPNDSRKIGNFLAYGSMMASSFPNAKHNLVVVTDTLNTSAFNKLKCGLDEMTAVRWQFLPLQMIGDWLGSSTRRTIPIVNDFGQWARGL
jgi:hypothetical protein